MKSNTAIVSVNRQDAYVTIFIIDLETFMIFTELVLTNFGPYGGKHIINLRPDTEDNIRPIILFGGMNGGGKTTLMDAIRLALYGPRAQCSTRGNLSYSDFLTQAVNNQTPPYEKTRIELAFEHIREDKWVELRIVRYWTKNPKDGKDNLGILEGEWPDTALANTWDEYIEKLLPLGISNLFLFDGEQVKELAEQDIPPTSVIEAIQSLLGLELAERLSVDLDVLVSRKRKALANTVQLSDLEKIEVKLKKYKQEQEEADQEVAKLMSELGRAKKKYKEASDKFRIEGGKIAAQKNQLELEKNKLETSADKQREELRNLATDMLPLALITPLLEQAKTQAELEARMTQAKIAQNVLQERDQRLLNYLSKISLSSQNLQKIEAFLEQENKALNQDIEAVAEPWLNINQEQLKQLVNVLDHQLPLQISLAEKQIEQLKNIEIDIDSTDRQLAVAASPEDYDKLDKALQEAQQEQSKYQAALDAAQHRSDTAKKAFEKIKKELQQYSLDVIERHNDEHLIKAAAKVQQTLQIFRERLTLKKLNKLEGEVTECFRYLLHKSDLVHRVVIDTQNFGLSLYDASGESVPKHRLSAGEKQLLAIAFLWGLARVSGRNLPVAIDTPLGRLDSSHRSNLVERYFPTASHQVILLSTDTEIGPTEIQQLKDLDAIAKKYLLKYNSNQRQTTVEPNTYFW